MKKSELKAEIKEYIVEILSEDEDREPTKSELEKEKVKTVSKFKIPTDQFEDFKSKLKTLVTKVKSMEKGVEKDKKMAALKQFIKKPELIKAFKERDVKIDTGDLIG
jgi:ribosomal protein S20